MGYGFLGQNSPSYLSPQKRSLPENVMTTWRKLETNYGMACSSSQGQVFQPLLLSGPVLMCGNFHFMQGDDAGWQIWHIG